MNAQRLQLRSGSCWSRAVCRAVVLATLLHTVAAQASPPEPTTDPAHPFARELMAAYERFYDVSKRGDLDAMKQIAVAAGADPEDATTYPDWLTRWLMKLAAYLMMDPQQGRFAAVDVAESGDAARLIYVQEGGKQPVFFAALLRKLNDAWYVGPTVSQSDGSAVAIGLEKLRSETDGKLCAPSEEGAETTKSVITRHGSEKEGYRIACRIGKST